MLRCSERKLKGLGCVNFRGYDTTESESGRKGRDCHNDRDGNTVQPALTSTRKEWYHVCIGSISLRDGNDAVVAVAPSVSPSLPPLLWRLGATPLLDRTNLPLVATKEQHNQSYAAKPVS